MCFIFRNSSVISLMRHVLEPERIQIDSSLTYKERPVKILDKKVHSTHNKDVNIVKVLWYNHESEEATWEAEAEVSRFVL